MNPLNTAKNNDRESMNNALASADGKRGSCGVHSVLVQLRNALCHSNPDDFMQLIDRWKRIDHQNLELPKIVKERFAQLKKSDKKDSYIVFMRDCEDHAEILLKECENYLQCPAVRKLDFE